MEQIRDISEVKFDVKKVFTAKTFLELVDNNVETAFYLGFLRDELQEPLAIAVQVRGDEGLALVKTFDAAMQGARPYVEEMTKLSNKAMEAEEFTLLEVVNAVVDNIEYAEPDDKYYVAFILGMWVMSLMKNDILESTDEDDEYDDFVEDSSADA